MLDSVIAMADADVVASMTKMLSARGIAIICGAKVVEISKQGLAYEKNGEAVQVAAENVLISVGRVPDCDTAALDQLGIEHERGKIMTDERLKTSLQGIYAIGDVNGKWMLAHKASAEGIVAVENIAGHDAIMSYDRIPQCIYTSPEIAWVGLTEKQARASALTVKCASFPMIANGKSMAQGNTTGFVKLISDVKTGELLGAHLVCAHATDMIGEIVLGMNAEVCAEDVAKTIHPHPTVSEGIMEAAEALIGKAIHSL
jgi:dihydrolipoamide dehydrogenase